MRGGLGGLLPGRAVQIGPPPRAVGAEALRLSCAGRPGVVAGERVEAGQVLYEPVREGGSGRVSPVSGSVRAVNQTARGWEVTLTSEGGGEGGEGGEGAVVETRLRAPVPAGDVAAWSAALRRWGPWPQGGLRAGLASQVASAVGRRVERLVLVGLDRYPPCPARSSVLLSFPRDAAVGLDALRRAVGVEEAVLLTAADSGVSQATSEAMAGLDAVRVIEMDDAYPAADPTVLAATRLLGRRRLDADASPMDAGLLLVEPWSAVRLGRWVSSGELDMVRPVMVTFPGPAPMSPRWAMPGQSLATLDPQVQAAAREGRALVGGMLSGERVTAEAVVGDDWDLVTLLAADRQSASRDEVACIDCGWCVQACPTRLMPIRLAEALDRGGRSAERARPQLRWCIECGLCSAVCPSGIPLAQRLREGRRSDEVTK